jgi:hypothetical protein
VEVRCRYLEFRSSGVCGEKVTAGDVEELRSESNALNHNPGELGHRLTPMNGVHGMNDIEGKVAMGSDERGGRRASFKHRLERMGFRGF